MSLKPTFPYGIDGIHTAKVKPRRSFPYWVWQLTMFVLGIGVPIAVWFYMAGGTR